ncbi:MAG: hypothetical protein AB1714_09335 [Acidobacteriota bacterium]
MRRSLLAILFAMSFSFALLQADVTISYSIKRSVDGTPADGGRVMFVKGPRLRIDDTIGGKTSTRIIDLRSGLAIELDDEAMRAITMRLSRCAADVSDSVPPDRTEVEVRPSQLRREIRGQSCGGYDLVLSRRDAKANARAWATRDAPGAAEYVAFWKDAASGCLPIEEFDPDHPASAENIMITEAFRRIAENGGMPYECVMTLTVSTAGKDLVREYVWRLTDVSCAPIRDDAFAVPSSYASTR